MDEDLVGTIQQNIRALHGIYDEAEVKFDYSKELSRAVAKIDPTLFRQVFTNIVRNGIEANLGKKLHFKINLSVIDETFQIAISNDGVPIPREIAGRIFDPYISSKTGKENMGLGLAIVKKIIIEHGGEISYVEEADHPTFVISLRRIS